jgi:transmembrane sensor
MTSPAPKPDADLDRDAREWFVTLLQPDLAPDVIAAWDDWMGASPAHAAAYQRAADAWAFAGLTSVPRPTAAELAADRSDGVIGGRRGRPAPRFRIVAIAAGVVLAVGAALGGWYAWEAAGTEPVRELRTARAEHRQAVLSDGSVVWLGGRTDLAVAFKRSQRQIRFGSGEAMFEVAHDTGRPFTVQTALGAITAVGTAFDVRADAEETVVSVTEGRVRVETAPGRRGGRPQVIAVGVGQQLSLSPDGIRLAFMEADAPLAPSWRFGRLEYRNKPLGVVLDDVNRYAERKIVIEDQSIASLNYTGTIQLNAIEGWVQALSRAFPVEVKIEPSRVVLRRGGRKQPTT